MQVLSRLFTALLVLVSSAVAYAGDTPELRMSMDDVFRVTETPQWSVKVERLLTLRHADVSIRSTSGYPFSMMLYFKCDTPDIAQFDTPEKISKSVKSSSEKYLPGTVEKKIKLQPVPVSYGSYTVLTDADVVKKSTIPPGEYKYLTRGMVRLSKDSALGFSLMTNDVTSPDYKKMMDYIFGFVKGSAKPTAQTSQQPQAAPAQTEATEAKAEPTQAKPQKESAAHPSRNAANRDLRKCLSLASNAEVMKCADVK